MSSAFKQRLRSSLDELTNSGVKVTPLIVTSSKSEMMELCINFFFKGNNDKGVKTKV